MCAGNTTAGAPGYEIEITPAMIDAGGAEYACHDALNEDFGEIARSIYPGNGARQNSGS